MSMTWFFFAEAPPPKMDSGVELKSMGAPVDVRERISRGLRNEVVWSSDGWGQYADDGCMLEFNVTNSDDSFVCVSIKVRGLGAQDTLLRLAEENGWCLVDDSLTPVRPL